MMVDAVYKGNPRSKTNTPRIDQSYPRSADHPAYPSELGLDYKYEPNSIGFILYHELAHHILMHIFPKLADKGLLQASSLYRDLIKHPVIGPYMEQMGVTEHNFPSLNNEKITDELAMHMLQRANHNWEGSGYQDDSGYQLVFEVPATDFSPGGYQITGQQTNGSVAV